MRRKVVEPLMHCHPRAGMKDGQPLYPAVQTVTLPPQPVVAATVSQRVRAAFTIGE
jgi:hypothetical protein